MEDKGIDPWTKEEFTKHRSNQIFANKENQIRYNNARARKKRAALANINTTLHANRNALQRILGDEKEIQRSRDFLLGAGYDFGVFTHNIVQGQQLWNCVYEYGITMIAEDQFLIAKIK